MSRTPSPQPSPPVGERGHEPTMQREIHFYAPGLKRFRSSEYVSQDPKAFVSISVTGASCALQCDHCESRILEGMPALGEQGLFEAARVAAESGAHGLLVSGGCDSRGRVPLLKHIADLKRIRFELGLTLRVHPGLPDEETAAALGELDLDGVMLDIIGAEETIREIYHLDVGLDEYAAVLSRLERHAVPLIPHIILGLHRGRMLGEWNALELIARHPPKILVLVILMPLSGTPMAGVSPPSVEEIGSFFRDARKALPDTPIMLGCARPIGPTKSVIDRLAVDAGLNGIAYPSEGVVGYARDRGLAPQLHDACCGVNW